MDDKKPKHAGGRPLEPIAESVIESLCSRLADGENLKALCEEFGFSWSHFYDELERVPKFSQLYERAQGMKAVTCEQQADDILSVPPPLTPDGKYDSAHVQWQKARSDVKLRIAERLSPTRQKVDQKISTPDGKSPFTIVVEVTK